MGLHVEEGGNGDPVVLLPGFTESADDVRGVFITLARRFRVIAVDLPGSGRSTPIPRDYSPDLYEEDARAVAELLRQRGIQRAAVVGFSDGGEVGLVLAARRPELVSALVVWGAIGQIPRWFGPTLDKFADLVDRPPDAWKAWRDSLVARYGGTDSVRRTVRSWSEALRALLDRGGDISLSAASQIVSPVLVITGERDPFAPPAEARELAAALSDVELHIVPGAGHSVHEDRAEWFNATVFEWLSKHAGAPATSA